MFLPHRKRPVIERRVGKALRLLFRLKVYFFVHPRHRNKKCRFHLQQRPRKLVHNGQVRQRDPAIEQGKIHMARRDVGERKK